MQATSIDRMVKIQADAGKQHTVAAKLFSKISVVAPFAMGGIADDRVSDMLQMAPDLVAPTGYRFSFNQGVAATRIAINGNW